MFPKYRVILDSDNIVNVIRIILLQVHKDLKLYSSLMVESFFVSDYLHSNELVSFIVIALNSLTKTTLTKKLKYFISIA